MLIVPVPYLKNLSKEMERLRDDKIPMVLLVSRSDCHFCHEVRTNYLAPLVRTVPESKLLIRELISDRTKSLIGADGSIISMFEFLKSIKVNFFPSVIFLGNGMRVLAEPLLGLNQSGFYAAYLDERIEAAIKNA
jgi:hypothetical protein